MSKRKTTEEFISDAILVHGSLYSYDKVCYINAFTKVQIECKIHGAYYQTPHDHLRNRGCPHCGNIKRGIATGKSKKLSQSEFIEKAIAVHSSTYDYSKVSYRGMTGGKVTIICKKHGEFDQTPSSHLFGSGCPKCGLGNNSKIEKEWLDFHGILPEYRQYMLPILETNRIFVDGFCPKSNTVYEFYGDFWHGNPQLFNPSDTNACNNKTFGWLYEKTISREAIIKSAGYNMITIWEYDYKKTKGHVK